MRRNRFIPEPEPLPDQELEALQATLNVLKPIRKNRQSKAERAWRAQKKALAELQQKAEEQQVAVENQQREFITKREAMAQENQAKKMAYESLKKWMGKEKKLMDDIEQSKNALEDLLMSCDEQAQQVETSLQTVNELTMAMEKLKFMQDELNEE